MRVPCLIILVLAMFMTSTLAWQNDGDEERDEQENTVSDHPLQYLLRGVNGILYTQLCMSNVKHNSLRSVLVAIACNC